MAGRVAGKVAFITGAARYLAPYVAAKHGVVGIARTMTNELARHSIRVNTVHPTGVDTPMGNGLGGLEPLINRDPNLGPIYMNTLPVESVDARDISNAVLFLASDEARAPEDTLNTLLTAMAERQIAVPTAGTVAAAATFRVVASMNPYDNVGTTRLSTSVHERICRLAIGYQDAEAERGIVALRAPLPSLAPGLYQRLVADAVAVTRATREHPDIRQGSSVRGAIDLTLVAGQLLELRGTAAEEYPELVYDAMVVALSGRIFLDETVDATPEAVLRQIWEDQFILAPATAAPG